MSQTLPPLLELLGQWQELDKGGTNLDACRALILEDRYYLLVRICGRADMLHPWIYERCREVEQEPDGFLDLWGREHYKSTIITFGGVLQAVLRNTEERVGIFSHTAPIAKAFLRQIKGELERNEKLLTIFPDILWENPQRDAPMWGIDSGIVLRRKNNAKEATIEAHGLVDGQPTSKHYSLLVYDDVVTRESVSTPEQISKTTESWELSDNLGMEGGRKWLVGTRYSYADTYEAIIAKGGVKVRLRPATEDGKIDGKPVLFSQEEWDRKKRDQGEATIACQMLQNPLAGKQRMFDASDLRIYEARPETLNVYITVDPARSKKKDSDDTAIVVTGVDYALNKYLLDGFAHKMDLSERWQRLREMYQKWRRAPGVHSVVVGYEKFGADADLDYIEERQRQERVHFEIEELTWGADGEGSKVDRVQRLGPDFRNGRYWLPYNTDPDWLRSGGSDTTGLTNLQRKMVATGHAYRVARPIRKLDSDNKVYDLAKKLRDQVHYFPFVGKKDVIDAASRVYDLAPTAPAVLDAADLEPSVV